MVIDNNRFKYSSTCLISEKMMISTADIVVDTKTGVNYLVFGRGGDHSITPLLDSEGKVVVTK